MLDESAVLALRFGEPGAGVVAVLTAELYPATSGSGLSLGDRVCPALGRRLAARVLTADNAWAGLDLPDEVRQIRSG